MRTVWKLINPLSVANGADGLIWLMVYMGYLAVRIIYYSS